MTAPAPSAREIAEELLRMDPPHNHPTMYEYRARRVARAYLAAEKQLARAEAVCEAAEKRHQPPHKPEDAGRCDLCCALRAWRAGKEGR